MSFAKRMKRNKVKRDIKGALRTLKQADRADGQVMRANIKQELNDMAIELTTAHNLTIIFFLAAYRVFGFAEKRLKRLIEKMGTQIECIKGGYVTVREIEQILAKEAHMNIEHKDIKGSHDRSIKWRVQSEMTAAFLISLLDGWGYKKIRLERVYDEAARIADGLTKKEFTMKDLEDLLATEAKYRNEAMAC